jgi:hypothetical protein
MKTRKWHYAAAGRACINAWKSVCAAAARAGVAWCPPSANPARKGKLSGGEEQLRQLLQVQCLECHASIHETRLARHPDSAAAAANSICAIVYQFANERRLYLHGKRQAEMNERPLWFLPLRVHVGLFLGRLTFRRPSKTQISINNIHFRPVHLDIDLNHQHRKHTLFYDPLIIVINFRSLFKYTRIMNHNHSKTCLFLHVYGKFEIRKGLPKKYFLRCLKLRFWCDLISTNKLV